MNADDEEGVNEREKFRFWWKRLIDPVKTCYANNDKIKHDPKTWEFAGKTFRNENERLRK